MNVRNNEIHYDSQMVYLWELNHEKDIKEVEDWQSWRSDKK